MRVRDATVTGRRAVLTMAVLFGGTVLCTAYLSPLMKVRSFEIRTPAGVEPHEFRMLEDVARVSPRESWLAIDLAALERRARAVPWVRSARAKRVGFRGVRLAVTARKAVACVLDGENRWEMDIEGRVLRRARRGGALPVGRLSRALNARPGDFVRSSDVASGVTAAHIQTLYPKLQGSEITVDQTGRICFNIPDGVPLDVGRVAMVPLKLAVAQAALEGVQRIAAKAGAPLTACILALDVVDPERPLCKPGPLLLAGSRRGGPPAREDR